MYAVIGIVVVIVCEVIDVLTSIPTSQKDKVDKADLILLDPVDAGGLKVLTAPAHHPSLQNVHRADESPSAQDIADLYHRPDTTSLDPLHLTIDKVRDQ